MFDFNKDPSATTSFSVMEYQAGETRALSEEVADVLHHSRWRKEGTSDGNDGNGRLKGVI